MTDSDEVKLLPCPKCRRAPKLEKYALNPQHGYLSCDCGITFNGHHGDSHAKLAERWNTRPPVVTDEVVERVARAICAELYGPLENGTWAIMSEAGRNGLRRCARKAIASMPAVVSGGQG